MVIEKVKTILAENLDKDPSEITAETTFEELGLDSLDMVDLLMTIEDECGVEIEPSAELATVGSVVTEIEKLQAQNA